MGSLKQHAFAVLCAAGLAGATGAQAATTEYAVSVTETSGAFQGTASNTLGAPNDTFIQLAFNSFITLDFGASSTGAMVLSIFTFDDVAEAFADIAVSDDNVSYTLLGNASDANGTAQAATFSVTNAFRYVRITDSADGSGPSDAGFDLDAVGRMVAPVPLPAGGALLLAGLSGLAALRRRAS